MAWFGANGLRQTGHYWRKSFTFVIRDYRFGVPLNVVEEEERAHEREFNTLGSCVPNATAAGMASFNAEDETEVARQLPGRRLSSPAPFSSWADGVCFVCWCDGATERCTAPRCTRVWHSACYAAGCGDNEAMMPGCCGPCAGGSSWLAVDQCRQ